MIENYFVFYSSDAIHISYNFVLIFHMKCGFLLRNEMSNKEYVEKFATAMYKAKDELVEQLKSKLVSEMDSNEALRLNLEKSEEQRKIAVEKNALSEAKIRSLEETLAAKVEIIKLLRVWSNSSNTDDADRKGINRKVSKVNQHEK